MQPLSFEAVNAAIRFRRYRRYNSRTCSICETPIGYIFAPSEVPGQSLVAFDGSCDCSRAFTGSHQPMAFHEFVQHFNMQTPEVRARMWKEFITLLPNEPLVPGDVRVAQVGTDDNWVATADIPVSTGTATGHRIQASVRAPTEDEARRLLVQALEAARGQLDRAIDVAVITTLAPP